MSQKNSKIILMSVAYIGLSVTVLLYLTWMYVGSIRPVGTDEQLPVVGASFILAIISLMANAAVVAKYKRTPRTLSIAGIIVSLIMMALLSIPLAFSLSA